MNSHQSKHPQTVHAIVLAAGKGTRMKSKHLPKVMFAIAGRPMLAYVLESLQRIGVSDPIVVVGFLQKKIRDHFGNGYRYVSQLKRLGTGHAVAMARPLLEDQSGCTLIINGDQPFFQPATLERLVKAINEQGATVAVLTGRMETAEFDAFGRVLTDATGHVERIVEVKDATEEEKAVRLMNLGGYAVDNRWLWPALKRLKKSRATGEYYITDIVAAAVNQGKKVISIEIGDKAEAIGINTLDHLAEAERLFTSR